jgi:hypothetical protein
MKQCCCGLVLAAIMLSSSSCCTVKNDSQGYENVVVKQCLARGLREYKTFNIELVNQSRDMGSTEIDHFGASVESDLWHALEDMGLERVFSNAQLRVECVVNRTWGLPRLGRNFYLHCTYKGREDIKLLDAGSGNLIGEVEYKRPRFALPPNDLARSMIEKLVKSSTLPVRAIGVIPKAPIKTDSE